MSPQRQPTDLIRVASRTSSTSAHSLWRSQVANPFHIAGPGARPRLAADGKEVDTLVFPQQHCGVQGMSSARTMVRTKGHATAPGFSAGGECVHRHFAGPQRWQPRRRWLARQLLGSNRIAILVRFRHGVFRHGERIGDSIGPILRPLREQKPVEIRCTLEKHFNGSSIEG